MTHPALPAAMSRPDFYPHRPAAVEVVQTHISFIFIAGQEVYKVKKAVDFGFLDFTTLEKRRFYCDEELRLNRRLAPETYREVIPITESAAGLRLGGDGPVVDYALWMRLLPRERMLSRLLAEGKVEPAAMDLIARKLADFHRTAETGGRIDAIGGIETIRRNQEENFQQTEAYIGVTIPQGRFAFIRDAVFAFIARHEALLNRRVAEHRIRDCHGDLHLEHICLTDPITIFDCIEFNERFRFGDVAAEVAFLAMDLDFNGYPAHAAAFVDAYVRHAGDPDLTRLLDFYRCYYAYVRGKVVGFRLQDPAIDAAQKGAAKATAARYFDLAFGYAARPERPLLIATAGLMGTGKSLLARGVAELLGAEVIRTDVVRKEMLAIDPRERHSEAFGQGIYDAGISRRTYERVLAMAKRALGEGKSVVIDASFRSRAERLAALETAGKAGVDFFLLECRAPEQTVRQRLDERQAAGTDPSDGRWEIFLAQKAGFEPVTELPESAHVVVDTAAEPGTGLERALRRIKGLAAGPA